MGKYNGRPKDRRLGPRVDPFDYVILFFGDPPQGEQTFGYMRRMSTFGRAPKLNENKKENKKEDDVALPSCPSAG